MVMPSSVSAAGAPVVLFLPAHNEEGTIADVVRRVPGAVHNRLVRCLVIDDGSCDRTAAAAAAAGAQVVLLPTNMGVGAAVRRGLTEGVATGAAVVAFCDADCEYDPADLGQVVGPILRGEADYVVGTRFALGSLRGRMRPHREAGNRTLTWAMRRITGLPITDGQSGYRALSARAAAEASIIHDYNYAQVLTLDLLSKGFRYAEVPISYHFRQEGTSFIKLGTYLRRVGPAVWRQWRINRTRAGARGAGAAPQKIETDAVSAQAAHPAPTN